MAEKTEDFWFIDIGCHSTSFRSAYCRFRGSIYAFTNHRDTYLVKIRNPNIEIRNKFELPKLVLRTPHPAGGAPVSNDQNSRQTCLTSYVLNI
jgi:hypothetical protein